MLPICLNVEAFGPYLLPQRVDFTRFADKFLIWGETGAGKTALLDAMTVALYGRASAEERGDMEALRCQLAGPERDTVVEFTFSVRGRSFRFWRRLRTVRRRKADSVEKTRLECGALELLPDGGERNLLQSDKAREQESAAEAVIGMGYAQFVQVMVLPQGKFERFLTADSSEKEKILKNIFRTDRFNDYQESLNRSFRAFDAQVREQEQAMEAQLRVYGADSPQALRDQLTADAQTLAQLRQEYAARKQVYEQANARAAQAQQLEERFARQDAARAALTALTAREREMAALETAVLRAERARLAAPADAEHGRLTRELALARQEAQRARDVLRDAAAAREDAAKELTAAREKQQEGEALRAELTAAQQRLPELAALDAARRAQEEARRLLEPAEHRVQQLQQAVRQQGDKLEQDRAALRELEQRGRERLPEAQALCDRYAQSGKAARTLAALQEQECAALAEQRQAERDRSEVNERAGRAMQQEAQRQEQYFSNAAHELAKRLEEGKPCPVCGSVHHPNAQCSSAYEGARQNYQQAIRALRQVQKELTDAAARCEGAAARLRSVQEQLTAARREAESLIPYDEKAERRAQAALNDAQRADARAAALQKELQALEQALARSRAGLDDAQREFSERQQALAAARTRVQETLRRAGQCDQSAAQLQQRIAQLRAELSAREQRLQRAVARDHDADTALQLGRTACRRADERAEQLTAQAQAAQAAFAQALADLGFADEAAYRAAALPEERIADGRARAQDYRQQLAAARAEGEAAERGVAGAQRPDLAAALAERDRCLARANESAMRMGTQEALVQGKGDLLARVRREGEKLLVQKAARDRMRAFVESFTYAKGVTLSSFVLSAMLGSVAQQANRLLQRVHGGRYQLAVKKASTRARLDGLELTVRDGQTGQERDVRTLSGGEKFLVSLSLSLGLSAVVRAQAGGVSMEAMFIDEGFGTLDPRSIKDALDVLTCIGSGSRVGIISHVDVLRENILQGIEVVKCEKGSVLRLRT